MERTWRWFGKKDKITLAQLRQIGVEGIVTALHDVPLGEVWTRCYVMFFSDIAINGVTAFLCSGGIIDLICDEIKFGKKQGE